MPKKPETILSKKVLLRLRAEGGWWFKVHGGPFQTSGIPDILGCYNGSLIAIELKNPGEEPTDLQSIVMEELQKAGAIVGVAHTVKEAVAIRDKRFLPQIL